MKKAKLFIFFLVLVCFVSPNALIAQTAAGHFDMTGFPQWARDLRRWEIIAFGAFPFAYFISRFGVDTLRFANNDWDRRFAPSPFNSGVRPERTQSEIFLTIGVAAGVAATIALVDHGIVRARRNRLAREERARQEEIQIIIRRSSDDDEAEALELETP